jgi:dipeptidyl aminopeptidase/acylaminoacyl peptidase
LDENEMAEMKPISFIARDGLQIHGYLTLPKGKKAKGLPVIVNPHAGPQWRNSWVFDQRTQFLANRGYAVLQVNFRGSMGYGKDFMRKGYRQFGLRMQDDITDGVNWLIKQGIADKNRIAIFGWSFGGYATLAGVTFTPDLYTCGIDLWGMSNLFSWYQSFPPYWKSSSIINKIHERWVDGSKDSVQMNKTSPALHADKIKVPLLIFQGANDVRVKRGQSDEMVEALKKYDKEVEYVLLEGIGHGSSDEETMLRMMKLIEGFLSKHMKTDN